jgi:hypothetical protein
MIVIILSVCARRRDVHDEPLECLREHTRASIPEDFEAGYIAGFPEWNKAG